MHKFPSWPPTNDLEGYGEGQNISVVISAARDIIKSNLYDHQLAKASSYISLIFQTQFFAL